MIRKHTTYTYEEDDNVFELPFEIDAYEIQLVIKGDKAYLGWITHDPDSEDPFKANDQGEVVQAPRYGFDRDEMKCVVRANPNRFYWVRSNHPELVTVKDTKSPDFDPSEWESYYICPDDAWPGYAESVFKEYRRWLDGEVYGRGVWVYNLTEIGWELDNRDEECWGFIGHIYAEEELKSLMEEVTK